MNPTLESDAPAIGSTETTANPVLSSQQWDKQMSALRTGTGPPPIDVPIDAAFYCQQIYGNLQQAETHVETREMRAASESYGAAWESSQKVPRQKLELQLQKFEQTRKGGALSPEQERALEQQIMNLDTAIRGSVFVLANEGLLSLRNGQNDQAFKLLSQAAKIDSQIWQAYKQFGIDPVKVAANQDLSILPMMKDDAHFNRHLATALRDNERITGDSSQVAAALGQMLNSGPQPDIFRTGWQPDGATFAGDDFISTSPIPGYTTGGAPVLRTVGQTDMRGADAPLPDSAALKTLMAAEQAFEINPDKKAALAAQEAGFKQAQNQAEADFTEQYSKLKSIDQQIAAAMPKDLQDEYETLSKQIEEAIAKLPQADQEAFKAIKAGQSSPEQAQAFRDAHPDLKPKLDRAVQLEQPVNPLILDRDESIPKLSQAMNDKVAAATLYASALAAAAHATGDKTPEGQTLIQKAHDVLIKGFSGVPQRLRAEYLADPKVVQVAKDVGALPADDADARTTPGGPVPYTTLMQNAHMLVKKNKGDITAAEPLYKEAIAQVEAQDPQKLTAALQDTLRDLKDPNISAQQRLQDHQQAIAIIGVLFARVNAHHQYAQMLLSSHRYKDAQDQLEAARSASTFDPAHPEKSTYPADLMQQEIQTIMKDLNNPSLPIDVQGMMSEEATRLQAMSQYPIELRKALAQFYLAGGKQPNGTPIGMPMIVGYDKTGNPLPQESVDTKILDPQKAADIVNETLSLQQSINDIKDIVNHPELDQTLAALRMATLNNAPDELKKQLGQSSHYWNDAYSTFWSTAAGLAVAAVVLYATKGEAASAFEDLNAGRLAWAGGLGFGTATGTNYALEACKLTTPFGDLGCGRDDFNGWDAALLGGGTFAAAFGTVLKGSAVAARAANFTSDTAAALALKVGRGTMGLAEEAVTPGHFVLQIEGDASKFTQLNKLVDATRLVTKLKDAEIDAMTFTQVMEKGGDAAQKAKAFVEATGVNPEITSLGRARSIVKGIGLKSPSQLAALARDYGTTGFQDLNVLAKNQGALQALVTKASGNSEELVKFVEAARAPGGELAGLSEKAAQDTKLLTAAAKDGTLVKNVEGALGATKSQRLGLLELITPKPMRGVQLIGEGAKDPLALMNPTKTTSEAAVQSQQPTRLGALWARMSQGSSNAFKTMQKAPGDLYSGLRDAKLTQLKPLNPWHAVSADAIPSVASEFYATTARGTLAGLTFGVGQDYFTNQTRYNKGDTTVAPWDATWDSLSHFTADSPLTLNINLSNPLIQSLAFSHFYGGVKVGTPVARTMGEAWQLARTSGAKPPLLLPAVIGAGAGLTGYSYTYDQTHDQSLSLGAGALSFAGGFFGSRALPVERAMAAVRAPLGNLWHGTFNILNPAESSTYSQFVRQAVYPAAMYGNGPHLQEAAMMKWAQPSWRESLAEIGKPITNETGYVPPTLDAIRENTPQGQPQAQVSDAQRQQGVPPAPADAQPTVPDPASLNPDMTGGIR